MIDLKTYINEGLIWTYDPYFTIERVINKFNIKNEYIRFKQIDNYEHNKNHQKQDIQIVIFDDDTINLNNLDKYLNTMGWYFSISQDHQRYYCPKFQHSINDKIHKKTKYLYHYTNYTNKDDVLKYGLIPKLRPLKENPQVFHYRNRIHFLINKIDNFDNDTKCRLIDMFKFNKHNKYYDVNHLIEIQIDISKLDINFYIDPNLLGNISYITYDNILPKYIKDINDYEI